MKLTYLQAIGSIAFASFFYLVGWLSCAWHHRIGPYGED